MEAWMIGILIVGAVIAIGFNIWNYKDNKKKRNQEQEKKKPLNLDKSYEQTTRPQTVDELEQTERILKMFKDRELK